MVTALKAMYTCVKACVRLNNEFSPFFDSKSGVKQGDPSSPITFMMFVNDLMRNIDDNVDGIFNYNELRPFLILYADDQVVFAKSAHSLS